MINTEQCTVYEHPIEELFHRYFEERGIDPEHDTVKQTKFAACWTYIYNILYKPDKDTKRRYNTNSKLDYNDIDNLNVVADVFISLCREYNIMPSQYNFEILTGISKQTLCNWGNKDYRSNLYYDLDGNLIKDIQGYKLNNKGEYVEKPTTSYFDLTQKIKDAYKEYYRQNLADTTVGQITIANNDEEAGLLYAQKEAKAKAEAWGRPQQRPEEIAERYKAYAEIGVND